MASVSTSGFWIHWYDKPVPLQSVDIAHAACAGRSEIVGRGRISGESLPLRQPRHLALALPAAMQLVDIPRLIKK